MKLTRRNFNTLGAASLGAALAPPWLGAETAAGAAGIPAHAGGKPFHFAIVSDTHIIDKFYKPGSENGVEDNETILKTADHLVFARDTINNIRFRDGSSIEKVFVPGDVFHNYPSTDYDFYFKNETRIDLAKTLMDGFKAPVHLGWGNHDYDIGRVSREMSHRLFQEKLKTEPYYAVDYKGFRFLHLNNFLGATMDPKSPEYKKDIGSLGETQLQWAEAQLSARRPTVVFIHYPQRIVRPTEIRDFGLHPLLRRYQDSICLVVAGHWHKWVDFAHTYGPQHTVTAATRYDQNAFMIFQADAAKGTVQWLDQRRVEWSTHFAKPYAAV